MNELFTVDYALNYEGWEYDTTVTPEYNVYLLDQFTIRVRRNDFFLVLFITNACDELVFAGRIYTISEYKSKIKAKLHKWKCRRTVNNNPSPSTQPLAVTPTEVTVLCTENTPLARTIFGNYYNEEIVLLNPTTVSSLIISNNAGKITIEGTPDPSTAGDYIFVLKFQGVTTGTIKQITLNITVLPEGSFIIQEDNSYILLENEDFILIE
jgi:hypothetical protein